MSRYPFNDRIEEYLEQRYKNVDDPKSLDTDRNRLLNIGRMIHQLKEKGTIQSDNPSRLTPNDIQCFIDERRFGGVSQSTINRDLSYLDDYLQFHNNFAVDEYYQVNKEKELQEQRASSEKAIRKIFLRNSEDKNDPRLVRAYAFVMLAIVFNICPEHLRKSMICNTFDHGSVSEYDLIVEDDYENEKTYRLDLNRLPIVNRYIHNTFPIELMSMSRRPLFPSSNPLFDFIGPDEVRSMKKLVEEDIGSNFDYTSCTQIYNAMRNQNNHIDRPKNNGFQFYVPPKRGILDRIFRH